MKEHVALVVAKAAMFVVLFSVGILAAVVPLQASEPIRIGMVASITGFGAMVGSNQKDAVIAVVEDINRKGGVLGRQIEVIIEDDKSIPTNAVIAATKLVRDLKVVALIGPSLPDSGMAMIPTAEQEQVPFIVGTPIPGELKKWVFHLGPSEESTAEAVLGFALNTLRAKRIALMYEVTNYGKTGLKIFTRDIPNHPGVSLVAKETFEVTDTNMVPQMARIKAAKPDLIVLYSGGPHSGTVAKNYKQLGITVPVLTANAAQGPDFLMIGGRIAEEAGWMIPVWKMSVVERLPLDDPFRKTVYEPFKNVFQDKYGKDRPIAVFHAPLVDCVNIVTAAIKLAGTDDRAAVRDALEKLNYDGLISPFACTPQTHRGSPRSLLVLTKLRQGEFVPYAP
jgi:branched-chain amino acid transport system substrate-binding protein